MDVFAASSWIQERSIAHTRLCLLHPAPLVSCCTEFLLIVQQRRRFYSSTSRMSDTSSQTSPDLRRSRLVLTFIHVAQLLLAVIILGLNVYGVHHVADNVLVFSVVVVRQLYLLLKFLAQITNFQSASAPSWLASIWSRHDGGFGSCGVST